MNVSELHANCLLMRTPCGASDCDAVIEAHNAKVRERIEANSTRLSAVVDNGDGSWSVTPTFASPGGAIVTGDIYRARTSHAPAPMNRRARRAQAARARHG